MLLKKYQKYFPSDFDFIPQTFILPDEIKLLKKHIDSQQDKVMIVKPSRGKGGEGIFFIDSTTQIDKEKMRSSEYVVQKYISNPLLIEKKKFDLRLYLLVKGVDTMEAYIALEGMVRFCTEEYKDPNKKETIDSKSKKVKGKKIPTREQSDQDDDSDTKSTIKGDSNSSFKIDTRTDEMNKVPIFIVFITFM